MKGKRVARAWPCPPRPPSLASRGRPASARRPSSQAFSGLSRPMGCFESKEVKRTARPEMAAKGGSRPGRGSPGTPEGASAGLRRAAADAGVRRPRPRRSRRCRRPDVRPAAESRNGRGRPSPGPWGAPPASPRLPGEAEAGGWARGGLGPGAVGEVGAGLAGRACPQTVPKRTQRHYEPVFARGLVRVCLVTSPLFHKKY